MQTSDASEALALSYRIIKMLVTLILIAFLRFDTRLKGAQGDTFKQK